MEIVEVTEEEVDKNRTEYFDRAERGEVFLVCRHDGTKYMMVPHDPNDIIEPPICDI